jgi:anaerobic selenocysteine-containing dehydrogenase
MLSACGHPENRLVPALIPDDEYVPGLDYWKASTCAMCEAGCGIVVRTREHKANKIEGNPLHPVNRGGLCARGQAGLQMLYNPDRIRAPLKRTGERGSGQFAEIEWEEAIKTLADKLREIKAHGRADSVRFLASDSGGVTGLAAELFMSGYGSKMLVGAGVLNREWNQSLYTASYGLSPAMQATPTFDIANARYLLSFGARFLETWHSPVMYSRAYGEFRRTGGKARGKLVQIEPRMSLTGANADEWLPAAAGTEGFVALAIAQVIFREGLFKDLPPPPTFITDLSPTIVEFPKAASPAEITGSLLSDFAPETTSEITGISAEKIIRIAREFASSQPALAIGEGTFNTGGQENISLEGGLKQVKAIHYLNRLASNLNKPGGVLLPVNDDFDALARLRDANRARWLPLTIENIASPEATALLIHQANPVYNVPRSVSAIKNIPFIASLSSFMDETTQLADLILPGHSYLESWDIRTTRSISADRIVSLARPVVEPEFNTKQTADVLLALSHELGQAPAFRSSEEIVKRAASGLAMAKGLDEAERDEDTWKTFLDRGVWVEEIKADSRVAKDVEQPSTSTGVHGLLRSLAQQHINDDEYPLTLLTYEHAMLGFGGQANLPWLQELPDPLTSVMWGSWVEINPKTAASLGITDGDLVEVRTREGAVTVPVVLYPAIRPDVVAMPYGQGHTAGGRYASGRGANAALLNPFASITGEAMTVRAAVSKVAGEAKLIRFGTELLERIETHRPR